ncbi:hypothetical protein IQ215_11760 [Cyanobacterium stanieri LEGE 03274]|uniref:Uncharacterized protein n=1 Tax=Cyanobacterium stanieri LEGE 03274 TaxID=1828756 RepID=A0ABR9V661_9CHRO|nr:hypothetical protein [Cyanobacterium stanieri]MBE9223373.1 hypothetical protein [Cyanobacterium stanieri LEGE 03274]
MINAIKKLTSNVSSFCFHSASFLLKTSPFLLIIFIAFGDRILPEPYGKTSVNIRKSITNALSIEDSSDTLENSKYNNRRSDKIVDEISR